LRTYILFSYSSCYEIPRSCILLSYDDAQTHTTTHTQQKITVVFFFKKTRQQTHFHSYYYYIYYERIFSKIYAYTHTCHLVPSSTKDLSNNRNFLNGRSTSIGGNDKCTPSSSKSVTYNDKRCLKGKNRNSHEPPNCQNEETSCCNRLRQSFSKKNHRARNKHGNSWTCNRECDLVLAILCIITCDRSCNEYNKRSKRDGVNTFRLISDIVQPLNISLYSGYIEVHQIETGKETEPFCNETIGRNNEWSFECSHTCSEEPPRR